MSRPERVPIQELELKQWMQVEDDMGWQNIEKIHREVIMQWITDPTQPVYTAQGDTRDDIYGQQPEWKPTFQDVEDDLNSELQGKLLSVMKYKQGFNIRSLDEEIQHCHITFLKDICDECQWVETSDSDDEEDIVNIIERIQNAGPQNVFNEQDEKQELCRKGLGILETIMDTYNQRLGEGDYVELCNILKQLYRV